MLSSMAALADSSTSILSFGYTYIVPIRSAAIPSITAINFLQLTIGYFNKQLLCC